MKQTVLSRICFGVFELDVKAGELHYQDKTILLQEQSLRLLLALIERQGELVTRDELQKQLWPNDTLVEFDLGINAAMRRLRRVLDDSPEQPKYIETVARRGYRLIVPVQRLSSTSDVEAGADQDRPTRTLPAEHGGLIGQEVSHYRILQRIGAGGMGVIYKAEDLRLGRFAALKFLPEEFGADARALAALEKEACLASSLNHPNICCIYELGEHDRQPFIAMELLAGETLKDRFGLDLQQAATPVPFEKLIDISIQVCEGLGSAHAKGIVHRDIKPANLFITDSSVVKILDFGLAKLVQGDASSAEEGKGDTTPPADLSALAAMKLSRTGIAIGTAAYMSPEHIRGERLDARTDLFSLGVVLYQMATGTPPFRGETPALLFEAVLHQTPVAATSLNPDLPAKLERIIDRALEKERNLRYQSAKELGTDLRGVARAVAPAEKATAQSETTNQRTAAGRRRTLSWRVGALVALLAVIISGGIYWRWRTHKPVALTDKDTIVVADFDNKTGDPVFDDTLKQGLTIQLEQSPFLALISQGKVNQTLKLMGRSVGDRVTPEVAHEVCQRTGSKAMITGSIANLGSQYVVSLKAVNCNTGDILTEAQEQASDKEAVLKALDKSAISLRSKLGESLTTVQQYATPLDEATTPSLEALQAYSQARKAQFTKGLAAALPFYQRAVHLDPNFAMAYANMATVYKNLNEVGQAAESARKAYALKTKVSEREMLLIEANYFLFVTGELEKAAQTYESWQQSYPRDSLPYANLGFVYETLGNLEKGMEQYLATIRLQPNDMTSYVNLGSAYANLNRLDEAEATFKQAEERGYNSENLLLNRYLIAFLRGDTAQMEQAAQAAMGKPGTEDLLLATQADTEAWYGKLRDARQLTRRAMDSALHNDAKETAATYQAAAALRLVESGYRAQAHADANAALNIAANRDVRSMVTLTLARAGDIARAEKLAAELDKAFPLDTIVQRYWIPTVRAAIALQRKDPNRALEVLAVARPVELGQPAQVEVFLCPAYLRGEAYLMLHNGGAAAAEFQKFIDHYGLVMNFPWGVLARLGLARAYALEAQTDPAAHDKARAAYQDFLTLWKYSDPDIPIYRQAKAEYAKLR
jgi:serine/threonine protein kinase/Tfp pilus assembly protein PilF